MASPKFTIKQNDTAPALVTVLQDSRGRPRVLTGATVVLNMRLQSDKVVKITGASVTITDASLGIVSYSFTAANTDTAGVYELEIQVTYSDSTIETFPNNDYVIVTILDDIA